MMYGGENSMPKWWRTNYTLLHLVLDVFLTELALFLAGHLVVLLQTKQGMLTGRWELSPIVS